MKIMEVDRGDVRAVTWTDEEPPDLEPGQTLLRVDHFALTANNVTYAVFGDAMGYWKFFPASPGRGRVPVWGYANVEASRADGIAAGERVYGYLPMASHLIVAPDRITAGTFVDASSHRSHLPPVYSQYQRVTDERIADTREREYAILRPLFVTSFLIDDWLADDDMFGAASMVVASASSKTALGLAFLLSARDNVEVVGLTSAKNADFVASVGYYDRTVTYDDIANLDASVPTAFVDMAGGGSVLASVHRHFGDVLQTCCLVGATHWEESAQPSADLPGPAPTFFFAPDRVVKRNADWGAGGLDQRVSEASQRFLASVDGWLTIVERRGPDELEVTWREVLDGDAPPSAGYIVSMR